MNQHTDPVEAALAHLYRSTTVAVVAPEVGAIVPRARRTGPPRPSWSALRSCSPPASPWR